MRRSPPITPPLRACQATLVLVLVVGCGQGHVRSDAGDGSVGPPGDASADAEPPDATGGADAGSETRRSVFDFCIAWIRISCDGNARCCADPMRANPNCDDDPRIESFCEERANDPALEDGTLLWRERDAQLLLDERAEAARTCASRERGNVWLELFEGLLGEGATCTPALPFTGSIGRFRCRDGLRCELTGTRTEYEGICAPLGAEGDSCNDDCGEGLWCDSRLADGDEPFNGGCAPQDDAAPCSGDTACTSLYCERLSFMCIDPLPAETWCTRVG